MAVTFVAGGSQYLINTGGAPLDTYPVTMCAWVNPASIAGNNYGIVQIVNASGGDRFQLQISDGGASDCSVLMYSASGGSFASAVATLNFAQNTWHHAIGIVTGAAARFAYMDGANEGTETTSLTVTALDDVIIGARRTTGPAIGNFTSGMIAEVGIWNVALDAGERAALAKGYSPELIRPSALVLYWRGVRNFLQDVVGGLTFTETVSAGNLSAAAHPRIITPRSQQNRRMVAAAAPPEVTPMMGQIWM